MSDRDRLIHPVTGCLIAIALMLFFAREQGVVPASELVVTPGPSEVTQEVTQTHSDKPSTEEKDLEAQQSMASAAWFTTYAAWGTAIISFLALIGLSLTVYYARKATHETRRIGRAQVRAYLSCIGGKFCASEDRLVVRPEFRNVGQSPAQNIRIVKLELVQREPDSPDILPNLISDLWFKTSMHENIFIEDIAPGAADNGCTEYEITEAMLEKPALVWGPIGDILWHVEGEIEWFDVFSHRQTLPFILYFDDETTDTDWFCGKLNPRD